MTEPHTTTGDQLLHDSEARFAAIEQTSREVAAITAVARTPDGQATVTVGAGGSVRSIDIGADAFRRSPAQLGPHWSRRSPRPPRTSPDRAPPSWPSARGSTSLSGSLPPRCSLAIR